MKWIHKLFPFVAKIEVFTLFYLLICYGQIQDGFNFYSFLVFQISFFSIGTLGYLLNDISDEKADKEAGKTNVSADLSVIQKLVLSLVLAVIGFVPIAFYCPPTIPLIVIEFLLLLLYAFPPVRLKEKGFLGLVIDSLYAYFLPSLILLTFLNSQFFVDLFFWILLPTFGLFLGISNILNHQLEDYDNDIVTQTKTFATNNLKGAERTKLVAIVASIVIFVMATIIIIYKFDYTGILKPVLSLISIVYLIKLVFYFTFKQNKYLLGLPELDFIFYGVIAATYDAFTTNRIEFIFFLLLLCSPPISKKLANSIHVFWQIGIKTYLRWFFSFIVNYSLYYFFLLVGINLKERAAKRKFNKKTNEIATMKSTPLSEKNVHGLWIGTELSPMELLTITSFISNGYLFHLWTYQPLKNELPKGCICCDANLILSSDKIFRYKYSSQFGTGKGSYAGFSDIFRYKLLYDKGGWWVDMDVTCLKPFDVPTPYFFRKHHDLPLVGNIMKAPKGSLVMKESFETAIIAIDENNRDWHKPINILYETVRGHQLEHCIYEEVSNPDQWHEIKAFVFSRSEFKSNWYFIHWCNEVWRSNGLEKSNPLYDSNYGQLLLQYNLIAKLSEKEVKHHDRMMKFKLIIDDLIEFL